MNWTQSIVMVLAFCFLSDGASAITRTWTGGAATSSWHDAANWSPEGAPQTGDDVVIDVPSSTITVLYSNGITTINSITCFENLTLSAGTLNVNSSSQISGVLTQSGGTFGGAGQVIVAGALNWTGGVTSGTGATVVAKGGTFTISTSGVTKALSRTIDNHGAASWFAINETIPCSNGTINNFGEFTMTAGAGSGPSFNGDDKSAFNNFGLYTAADAHFGILFNNQSGGLVHVMVAIHPCALNGGGTHDGEFSVDANATLEIKGTHVFNATSIIAGEGDLSIGSSSGSPIIHGEISMGGQCLTQGLVTFNGPVSVGLLTVHPTTTVPAIVNGALVAPTVSVIGWLQINGSLLVTDTLDLQGYLENSGTMHFNQAQSIDFFDGSIDNSGLCIIGSPSMAPIQSIGVSNSFTNTNTGSIMKVGTGATQIVATQGTLTFSNQGTVFVSEGTLNLNTTMLQYNVDNNSLTGGTWRVADNATLNLPRGVTVRTLTNAVAVHLEGPNSAFPAINTLSTIGAASSLVLKDARDFVAIPFNGTFVNHGTLSLGSQCDFDVTGSYHQGTNGKLVQTIDSTDDQPFHSVGSATLAGTFQAVFGPGFELLPRTFIEVITSDGTISGTFSSVNHPVQPACSAGLSYQQSNVRLQLESVPPVALCQNASVQLSPSGMATIAPELVDGGSFDNCIIVSRTVTPSVFTCANVGPNTVTLTVTDQLGYEDTCQATVTVLAHGNYEGPAGGSWFNAANWCGSYIPGPNTNVLLNTQVLIDQENGQAASIEVLAGGELVVGSGNGGSLAVTGNVIVRNGGTLTITQNGSLSAVTMNVQAGGTLTLAHPSATLSLTNLALQVGSTLNWTAGTIVIDDGLWLNSATATIPIGCSGDLAELVLLNGAAVHAGQLDICAQGTFSGNGTANAAVVNGGAVAPGVSPGALTINRPVTLENDGTLDLEIAGSSAGTFDALQVNDEVALGGHLRVSLLDKYVPALNQEWIVLTSDVIDGAFDSFELPAFPDDLYMRVLVRPTFVQLRAQRPGDVDANGAVDVSDLLSVINAWGTCPAGCDADVAPLPAGDQVVDVVDLLLVISSWG